MDEALKRTLREANQLAAAGRFADAEAIYRRAIESHPDDEPLRGLLCMNLAAALASQEKFEEALPWHERAAALRPIDPAVHINHGTTLTSLTRTAEALLRFERAVQLAPDHPHALHELARCNHLLHRNGLALHQFTRVLELAPGDPVAHAYLAQTLRELGRFDEALRHLARSIELDPGDPEYRYTYGLNLIMHGRWKEGWLHADARWQMPEMAAMRMRLPEQVWDGSPLNGKTIYLQPEQGAGDRIHFIRYAALVAERGAGRVIVGCDEPIRELLASAPGVSEAVVVDQQPPPCDCWIPLMSLPRVFGTELSNVPATVPYLRADRDRVEKWSRRLGERSGRRVGLVWAGNPIQMSDWSRSTTLAKMAPFAGVRDVQFFSLQKGNAAEQAKSPPAGMELIDLSVELNDFTDTAAVIENLDLVITVDTSVAHLAGALGKPVWVLLSFSADWRYMLNRTDSPWYPTMKLFRQKKLNDWDELMRRVATAIAGP